MGQSVSKKAEKKEREVCGSSGGKKAEKRQRETCLLEKERYSGKKILREVGGSAKNYTDRKGLIFEKKRNKNAGE